MTEQELIGRSIARIRKLRGMKQVDLGSAIGVSDQTISNWEVGLRTPRADHLRRMCKALDCSADSLLGLDREPTHTQVNTPWRDDAMPSASQDFDGMSL